MVQIVISANRWWNSITDEERTSLMKKHYGDISYLNDKKIVTIYQKEHATTPATKEQEGISKGGHTEGQMQLSHNKQVLFIGPLSIANTYGHSNSLANAARILKTWNEHDNLKAENEALKSANKELYEALMEVSPLIDALINRTPTGKQRAELCDINIKAKKALNSNPIK